jgi:hypothetical protein
MLGTCRPETRSRVLSQFCRLRELYNSHLCWHWAYLSNPSPLSLAFTSFHLPGSVDNMGANNSVPADYSVPAYTILAIDVVLTTAAVGGRTAPRRMMKTSPATDDYLCYFAFVSLPTLSSFPHVNDIDRKPRPVSIWATIDSLWGARSLKYLAAKYKGTKICNKHHAIVCRFVHHRDYARQALDPLPLSPHVHSASEVVPVLLVDADDSDDTMDFGGSDTAGTTRGWHVS